MTASPISPDQSALWTTAPVIDYEPAPVSPQADPPCPGPLPASLHRRPRRVHRPRETPPPRAAVVFAETALRQVIEVIDRRRPVAQLRRLMTPVLVDYVIGRAGTPQRGSATLRRVRVRGVDTGGEPTAAEVFATFVRAGRVHAVAARIEPHRDRWRLVALQIG
ncbi:hypothetical protein JDV09_20225 [Mycobacterium sp. Y57]|uniref:Rv3235 family protein n=1 Tax=Mycolicibacterium xanthum TaxID=2796469 RepID=UPI001C85E1E8|nr:Rv3235 family protein [Mycolicibacterium xanthum]MBX7434406.1 hypothetical protein [Mycolicibacterium xanthum]